MERLNQTPDSQARTLVVLLGVASAAVVVVAATRAGGNQAVAPFVALLAAAVLMECVSTRLPDFGYVSLAFYVYFAAMARPADLYSGGRLPGSGSGGLEWDPLAIVSQAILMAFFAMFVGWVFRVTVLQDNLSNWSRVSDFCINLLRIAALGMVYLHLPGLRITPEGTFTLAVFSLANLGGLVLAVALYWCVDRFLSGTAVLLLSGEAAQKEWLKVQRQSGWLVAGVLCLSTFVTLWVAVAAKANVEADSPVLPLVLGLLAGALPVLVMNRAVGESVRAVDQEQLDILEARLRGTRLQLETLQSREETLSQEVQKKAGALDMLSGMARDLGAATNLQDTLDIVVGMIKRMDIPFQSCVVFLLQDGQALPIKSETPYREVLEMSHLLQLEEGLVSKAAKSGRPQLAAEMRSSSEQRIFKDEHSVVCAPLIVSKEPIGVIYLGAREAGTYTEEIKNTLDMLAAHAAPSILTARLFEDKEKDLERERKIREEVEGKNRQLSGLQKMVQAINENMKLDHSLNVMVDGVKELIPEAQSIVVLLARNDEDNGSPGDSYLPARTQSPYEGVLRDMALRPGEGLVGQAILHKSQIVVNDTRDYSHPNLVQKELSAIAAPLVTENDTLGCLYVGAAKEEAFSSEAQSLVATIAAQAAMAIKNARLMDEMEKMSFTDGLTGLYSHRYFKEQLKQEVEWAKRSGKSLALVLVDTDKFKQYNDTLGHPAGDALLQQIGDILTSNVRATDIVCRQGGDEFALIMKESPKENAVQTAEKIREAFMYRFSSHKVQVTSSIGVACFPTDASSLEELAQVADEALYKSKHTGRNRVSVAPSLDEKLGAPVG